MWKKYFVVALVAIVGLVSALPKTALAGGTSRSTAIAERLKGYVLLQVEQHGEAWYVDSSGERYYIKDGAAAYKTLRSSGGVQTAGADIQAYLSGKKPDKSLKAKVLIKKESSTDMYYVCPNDMSVRPIDSAAAAWKIVQTCHTGISNKDIATIPIGTM